MRNRFVINQDGRNIVPMRNGEFEFVMSAPDEFFITGPAVNALARFESYPEPGEQGCIIDPETNEIVNVEVKSITFDFSGCHMHADYYLGKRTKKPNGWDMKCIPGETWFKDFEQAKVYRFKMEQYQRQRQNMA